MAVKKKSLSNEILKFYQTLSPDFSMPEGVSVMHPYGAPEVWSVVTEFYQKFYGDRNPRMILFGINPGRFGAGVTGVPFTDPIRLENVCGVSNPFEKRFELSSEFVYEVVEAWGGPQAFYASFFVSALSPLGFLREGKNLNYYDDKELCRAATPFILDCVVRQKKMCGGGEIAFCLGEGTNYKFFCRLNAAHGMFREIIPLPHPRWVMQYRRKSKESFVQLYVRRLKESKL
jgi:hypothetical protein